MEKRLLCVENNARGSDGLCGRCWDLRKRMAEDLPRAIRVLRSFSPPVFSKVESEGWVGVDLDGTLAHYDGWKGIDQIGAPIPLMVDRVQQWLAEGKQVRIMTARVHPNQDGRVLEVVRYWIEKWCLEHIGQVLPITHEKDFGMICLYDDRCIRVEKNTGRLMDAEEEQRS
jgi:hypothetical protein